MIRSPALPFDKAERNQILKEIARIQDELSIIRLDLENDDSDQVRLDVEDELVGKLLDYRDLYDNGTPIVDISRCPFTGLRFSYPIDTLGLDGLWWDLDDPVRADYTLLPTAYAITGAVSLANKLEKTQFVVAPGPGSPFVIPRLLEVETSAAVISSVKIGAHKGFAIVYFSESVKEDRPFVDEWGSNRWFFDTPADDSGWDTNSLSGETLDFDLRPWIDRERLFWIAPDDTTVTPHKGLGQCPYLDLEGTHNLQILFDGNVQ